MSNDISCPNCRKKIDASETLWLQLNQQIRSELEFEFHDGRAAIYRARRELEEQRAKLEADRQSFEEKIRAEVEKERAKIFCETKEKITKSFELELKVRDQQVIELRRRVAAAQKDKSSYVPTKKLSQEKAI